ncbi:ABC transporter substrate-binding protein [uncultured Agrococcus sp.]|uniref:ABC transporter substrate-binding protein n=1 Tax=uncultured Agrococcus sp. TaxID=382258 RepID=UPI002600CC0A|nr:ABC transporter substrate-binding protein [uncultured Agrococcus sp.]
MTLPLPFTSDRRSGRTPLETRHRVRGSIALLAASAVALTGCGAVTVDTDEANEIITVTDDQGREVEIEGPVERAVVLNSYGNEFVRAIGAGDTVVGVDRTSLDRLPYLDIDESDLIAEGLDQLNYEAIAELSPDVVVLPRNAVWQEASTQLEAFGIPVVVATAWDYAAFEDTVHLLGEVFDAQEGAEQLLGFNEEIHGLLDERLEGVEPVSVYFETAEPYLTVLPGSGFHAMIEAAGGDNVFADVSGGDAQEEITVDPAEVVTRAPDVIFHEFNPSFTPVDQFETLASDVHARPGFASIPAVQKGEIYVANGWATSASAKAIGALYLATWLHPEQFEGVDPDAFLERWVTEFQQAEFTGSGDYVQGPFEG